MALNGYLYPVKLSDYENRNQFPGYFSRDIVGDRNSTISFEDYFRQNSSQVLEVYFEVIFWKLYSQANIRQQKTTERICSVRERNKHPTALYAGISSFVHAPNMENLQAIRNLLGIKTDVLAVALTFPAFLCPEKYPMIDNVVARWVNKNLAEHSRNTKAKLTQFVSPTYGYTSLRDVDFPNYKNWVNWSNEMAHILTNKTSIKWRARDVEMAIFTAQRLTKRGKKIELSSI